MFAIARSRRWCISTSLESTPIWVRSLYREGSGSTADLLTRTAYRGLQINGEADVFRPRARLQLGLPRGTDQFEMRPVVLRAHGRLRVEFVDLQGGEVGPTRRPDESDSQWQLRTAGVMAFKLMTSERRWMAESSDVILRNFSPGTPVEVDVPAGIVRLYVGLTGYRLHAPGSLSSVPPGRYADDGFGWWDEVRVRERETAVARYVVVPIDASDPAGRVSDVPAGVRRRNDRVLDLEDRVTRVRLRGEMTVADVGSAGDAELSLRSRDGAPHYGWGSTRSGRARPWQDGGQPSGRMPTGRSRSTR